jgi:menaquinone-specific isochorismate synthase
MMAVELTEKVYQQGVASLPRLFSMTQKIASVALHDVLNDPVMSRNIPLIYWRDPHNCMAFAGLGSAKTITSEGEERFSTVDQKISNVLQDLTVWSDNPEIPPRFFGGFAFNEQPPDKMWSAFPSAMFILPKWMISQREGGETWLTLNVFSEDYQQTALIETIETFSARLGCIQPAPVRIPQLSTLYPMMSPAEWDWMIDAVTERIRFGDMEKVVLARTLELSFDDLVPAAQVVRALEERYPDCYTFLVQPQHGRAFFGATPELLVEKSGFDLRTAALAGSRPRGRDLQEDELFGADLLHSAKDHHEHALVVEEIRDCLTPYALALDIPNNPSLLRLSNIQHLHTPIHAELGADNSALDFVERLHPTPAMGGYPRMPALEVIAESESVARGWYASPLGWVDCNGDGVFVAAIRSAVSAENKVRLYAGAGIVADSESQTEWAETALKFKPLLTALNTTI